MEEQQASNTEGQEPNPAAGTAFWMATLVGLGTLLLAALFENPVPFIGAAILAILVLVQAAKTRSKTTVVVTGILLVFAIPFALWLFLIWALSQDHS